jgi:MOSC domain-containing protein YiiM
VHGEFGEVLAGRLLHLLQALERKAVEQGDEAAVEVTGWGSECALLDAARGHRSAG